PGVPARVSVWSYSVTLTQRSSSPSSRYDPPMPLVAFDSMITDEFAYTIDVDDDWADAMEAMKGPPEVLSPEQHAMYWLVTLADAIGLDASHFLNLDMRILKRAAVIENRWGLHVRTPAEFLLESVRAGAPWPTTVPWPWESGPLSE